MGQGIKNRIFGSDIPKNVKQKIEYRQAYAKSANPGESITTIDDKYGESINYKSNFNGEAELSSRTPFARMWVAVAIFEDYVGGELADKEELKNFEETHGDDPNFFTTAIPGGKYAVHQWMPLEPDSMKIYEVGNHVLNTLAVDPNSPIGKGRTSKTEYMRELLPYEQETDRNTFLKPPAGITSVSSETEGALGVIKRVSINFIVHNFHDFEKIYLRYFLRPGAQVFVDFGWDTAYLYDPANLIDDTKRDPEYKGVEDALFGDNGVVTLSNGDLETLIGNVVNYDAKVREDGGFDCSVEIVSKNMALLSHETDNNFKGRVEKGLDIELIGFAAKGFTGVDFMTDQSKNWVQSSNSAEELDVQFKKFAASNLGGEKVFAPGIVGGGTRDDPSPSMLALKHGIYYGGADENNLKLFVCWGFFEDKILNKEFGFGQTEKDTTNDVGTTNEENFSAKFNSRNSFITYNKFLYKAQKLRYDEGTIDFLYPVSWGGYGPTYNTLRNMVPDGRSVSDEGEYWMKTPEGEDLVGEGVIEDYDKSSDQIPLREIFISVQMIKDVVKTSDTPNDILKGIMGKIKQSSQEIIDLQLSSNNYSSHTISIIDKNKVVLQSTNADDWSKDLLTFKPHSPDTIVKDFNLSFSTPKGGLQNMIAIQSTGNLGALPVTGLLDTLMAMDKLSNSNQTDIDDFFIKWLPFIGTGAADRLKKNITFGAADTFSFTEEDMIFGEQNPNATAALNQMGGKTAAVAPDGFTMEEYEASLTFATDPEKDIEGDPIGKEKKKDVKDAQEDAKDEASAQLQILTGTPTAYWLKKAHVQHFSKVSPVIPIELSLKIYGISSLVPGDLFTVDYLPKNYLDHVYFQITKISHNVGQTWDTELTTVMRIKTPEDFKKGPVYSETDIPVMSKNWLKDKLLLNDIDTYITDIRNLRYADALLPEEVTLIEHFLIFTWHESEETTTLDVGHTDPYNWTSAGNAPVHAINIDPNDVEEFKEIKGKHGTFDGKFKRNWTVTKAWVWDYGFKVTLEPGKNYYLITHGPHWIVFPVEGFSSMIKAFNKLFKLGDEYSGGDPKEDKGKDSWWNPFD